MRKTETKTKFKSNKGITLIALVITIIVLLILAGVAISMLSGENGILRQAGKAKTEYEEAAKREEDSITDTGLNMELLSNGINNLTFTKGALTGTGDLTQLEKLGYEIKEIKDEEGNAIKTEVLKDKKLVATKVKIGDVDGDGNIAYNDYTFALNRDIEYYQKVAGDVNFDGFVNIEDGALMQLIQMKSWNGLNQNTKPKSTIVVEDMKEYKARQMELIGINSRIIKTEWYEFLDETTFENSQHYKAYIKEDTITLEDCVKNNTDDYTISVFRDGKVMQLGDEATYIENGDIIKLIKMYDSQIVCNSETIVEFVINE